jgi:hypothetical protein
MGAVTLTAESRTTACQERGRVTTKGHRIKTYFPLHSEHYDRNELAIPREVEEQKKKTLE